MDQRFNAWDFRSRVFKWAQRKSGLGVGESENILGKTAKHLSLSKRTS